MVRITLLGLPLRSLLVLGTLAALLVALLASPALAQHPAGRVAVPPHAPIAGHVAVPRATAPPIFHRPAFTAPPIAPRGEPNFGIRTGPFPFPRRHRFLFAEPFFGFGAQFWLQSYWLTNCDTVLTWEYGCYGLPSYPESYGTYLVPQTFEVPVPVYGGEGHDEVKLFLKDGTIYNVTDYWFVNGQIHFTLLQELPDGGYENVERLVGEDELDVSTTVDVNTRRGFRMVKRNEPWRKYLQDNPDGTPPVLGPPQAN